ncbi:hypothetical protein AB7M17_005861 [Bradyrhizobium sp. USDA 377]
MKTKSLIIAAAVVISLAGATAGFAAELPTYEVNGLPISPVQVGVLGGAHVQEQPQVTAIVLPSHQLKVPTPRPKRTAERSREGRAMD